MEYVAINQEDIHAYAGWEKYQMAQILDADLCLAKLNKW